MLHLKKHYFQLIYELEKKLKVKRKTSVKTNLSKSLGSLVELIKERSLIIIFSDFQASKEKLRDLFQTLQSLKYKKHEIILFHVSDLKKEKDLSFSSDFYKFIDLETNEEISINPFDLKEKFKLEKENIYSSCHGSSL